MIGLDGSIIVTVKRAPGEATGGIISLSPGGAIQWHYGIAEDVSGCAAIDQAGNIHFGTQSGNHGFCDLLFVFFVQAQQLAHGVFRGVPG